MRADGVRAPHDPGFKSAISAQMLAASPEVTAWVTANAGSGKTRVLADRVSRLLLLEVPPSALLCMTFTKAAAAEMKARLFSQLGAWSTLQDDLLAASLSALTEEPINRFTPARLRKARALFARALETPGGIKIQTIHAFCAQILQAFPLEAGLRPGFTVLEEADAKALLQRAVRDSVATPEGAQWLQDLVQFGQDEDYRDRLTIACQGIPDDLAPSVAARAAAVALGVKSWPIDPEAPKRALVESLDLEFLQTCAGRLAASSKARDQALGRGLAALVASPPSLRAEAAYAAFLTKDGVVPKALATAEALRDSIVEQLVKGPLPGAVEQAFEAERLAQAGLRAAAFAGLAATVRARYVAAKREAGVLDFRDLIAATKALLTHVDAAQWALFRLDQRIDHILVDEAQDTAPEQWEIVNAVSAEFFVGEGQKSGLARTIFVVGDEKQSIYSFQGADPARFAIENQRLLVRAGGAYRGPTLSLSFRSCPEILAAVDATFALPDAAMGDMGMVVNHAAFRAGHVGRVEAWPLVGKDVAGEASAFWDAPLDHVHKSSAQARLAQMIASEVRRALQDGDLVWDEMNTAEGKVWRQRPLRPGDVMILVRKRNALFEQLIRALKRQGVPTAGADRLNLVEHLSILDLLALAQFGLAPHNDLALANVLKSPFVGLTDDDLDLLPLCFGRKGVSVFDRLQASDDPRYAHAKAMTATLIERAAHLPPFAFFASAMEDVDPHGQSGWYRVLMRLGREARDMVEAFLARASASAELDLGSFVDTFEREQLDLKREADPRTSEVRVMTVHGAKGLEAPLVILPEGVARAPTNDFIRLDDGTPVLMPSRKKSSAAGTALHERQDQQAQTEDRRLLYVAMTRARDRLILAGCDGHAKGDGEPPSPGSWLDLATRALGALKAEKCATPAGEGLAIGAITRSEAGASGLGLATAARAENPTPLSIIPQTQSAKRASARAAAASPLSPDAQARFRRGTLIHLALQRVPDVPPADRLRAATDLIRHMAPDLSPHLVSLWAGEALRVMDLPDLARLFGTSSRAEVPIIGRLGPDRGRFLGRIDRLHIDGDEIIFLDYKTNRPPPLTLADCDPAYIAQMQGYAQALSDAFPRRRLTGYLVWTDGPHTTTLDHDLLMGV